MADAVVAVLLGGNAPSVTGFMFGAAAGARARFQSLWDQAGGVVSKAARGKAKAPSSGRPAA